MKISIVAVIITMVLFAMAENGKAQTSLPDVIHAFRIHNKINVDGNLSEPAWQKAVHISNFTQRELNEGKPAAESTEVAILYDLKNLYIGVWCFDPNPDKLVAEKMKRDFDFGTEDNFKIVIDSYHDKRNGYLLITNPNGARFDALIQDNGQHMNTAWNGVWTVKTKVTNQGWFAEFQIPFSTLKFSTAKKQLWGINFERDIRRKREQDLWQGWSRNSDLEQVARAGTLAGIEGVNNVTLVELKPYGIAGFEKETGKKNAGLAHAGGDLNYLITPTMKLNLTMNTDFAQVESDRMKVNLTRFSLFFPEKREFFLEGRNYFNFGLGDIRAFYTRRIGLSSKGSKIPILAGVRLLGKTGNTTLGGMSIQTQKKDSIPTTNYTILRWKQDMLKQSSIGIIGVGKIEPHRQNFVYGTDFLYSTSNLFDNKNFSVGGAVAQSYTSDKKEKTGLAQSMFIDYPNDLINFSAEWDRSSAEFNPETGFLRRRNYQMYSAYFSISPRPKFLPWIQRLNFKPMDFNYYIDDQTKKLQSLWTEFRPLRFTTKSGDFFESNIQRKAENLVNDFEIHNGINIPAGEYWFTDYELQFATFHGRPAYIFLFINWGGFYNGTRKVWFERAVWHINKHISVSSDFTQTIISLPGGKFTVNEFGGRLAFAVNPDLFGSLFTQWNNDDKEVLLNFRVNWIPAPGTNFYFVVNQSFNDRITGLPAMNTTILTKLIWRFVL